MHHNFQGRTARELARSIERAVHSGKLSPGEALPPIRQLAETVGLSPVTVAAAYRRLHSRGILVGHGRRGTQVRPNPVSPLVPLDQRAVPEGLFDLATGNPDPELLPSLPARITPTPRLYGQPSVHPGLAAFAAGEFAADGIVATQTAVVSGALDAFDRLLREHLRPGDRVAVEDPGLPAVFDLVGASGFMAVPIQIDGDGPVPSSLEQALSQKVRCVIVTPRAQNPTGAAFSKTRAAQLARSLKGRDDVLIIENDPAGPIAGVPYFSICRDTRRWAVVRSVSKFLGPDLRVAVVAGDELTIARVQGRQSLGARWVSHVLQELALSAWSDPSSGRRLAHAADVYATRRKALIAALAAHDIHVEPRSGFHVWIPVREESGAVQHLASCGWAVAAGERFRMHSPPAIRITTAALPIDLAPRVASDVAAAVMPSSSSA